LAGFQSRLSLTADSIDYNDQPHGAHGWRSPAELAEAWKTTNQLQFA
jgi:hypothetical protein